MPRWEGHTPRKPLSPERLEYFRAANRASRERMRGGDPPMPHTERGTLGAQIARLNRLEKQAEARKLARRLSRKK